MLHRQALELVEDWGHCLSSDTLPGHAGNGTKRLTPLFSLPPRSRAPIREKFSSVYLRQYHQSALTLYIIALYCRPQDGP